MLGIDGGEQKAERTTEANRRREEERISERA